MYNQFNHLNNTISVEFFYTYLIFAFVVIFYLVDDA